VIVGDVGGGGGGGGGVGRLVPLGGDGDGFGALARNALLSTSSSSSSPSLSLSQERAGFGVGLGPLLPAPGKDFLFFFFLTCCVFHRSHLIARLIIYYCLPGLGIRNIDLPAAVASHPLIARVRYLPLYLHSLF
jgi:hypothetical protein